MEQSETTANPLARLLLFDVKINDVTISEAIIIDP
jgi:hypothetical protein